MKRFPRPSPAMVVALLALVLAAAGTATAALTGKDKKKVRSIADQEIAKTAAGLSVSSAQTANSAQSANSANSAGSAQTANTAQNATALGGVAANGYPLLFSGHANDSTQLLPLFSVPQLGIALLTKNSPATGALVRVRNDSTVQVVVGTTADSTTGTSIAAGGFAEFDGTATPLLITEHGKPGVALMLTCAEAADSNMFCFGLLET
jgi:hypothetical protein